MAHSDSLLNKISDQELINKHQFEILRFALDKSTDAVFISENRGRHFIYVNDEACRSLGYSRSELLKMSVYDIDPVVCPEGLNKIQNSSILDGPKIFETRHKTKKGIVFPVEITLSYFLFNDKYFGLSHVRNFTERKLAEEERLAHVWFLESIGQVNMIIQGTNDLEQMMGNVLDALLSIFNCHRAFLVCRCDPDTVSWQSLMVRTHPEYSGDFGKVLDNLKDTSAIEQFKALIATNGAVTFGPGFDFPLSKRLTEHFGIQSMIAIAINPKGKKPYVLGLQQCSFPRVWSDIEKVLVQEIGQRLSFGLTSLLAFRDLQKSEAKYRRIVDTASEGIRVIGPDNMTISVSPRMSVMLGYSCEEMIGRPLTDFMFEEDVPDYQKKIRNRRHGLSESYERRFRSKDGKTVWTHVSASPILDDEHQYRGSFAMFTDITDRKLVEGRLAAEEDKFKILAENSPVGIFILMGRKPIYLNKALLEMLGVQSIGSFRKMNLLDLVHPKDKGIFMKLSEKIFDENDNTPSFQYTLRSLGENDRVKFYDSQFTVCKIDGRRYVQIIVVDITGEIEKENALNQLAADSLYINQKNSVVVKIKNELNDILLNKGYRKNDFRNILQILNSYSKTDSDWALFNKHFENLHPGFLINLKNTCPSLTVNDIKHCACIRLNLDTKEIARFFNVSPSSVQTSRVRLKKKLKLCGGVDLRKFINEI